MRLSCQSDNTHTIIKQTPYSPYPGPGLGPDSDRRVRVLYSNILGVHANLDELAAAGSDYVLVCAESKISDRRRLSAPYPWCWFTYLVPRVGKDSAPSGAEQVGLFLPRVLYISYLSQNKKNIC